MTPLTGCQVGSLSSSRSPSILIVSISSWFLFESMVEHPTAQKCGHVPLRNVIVRHHWSRRRLRWKIAIVQMLSWSILYSSQYPSNSLCCWWMMHHCSSSGNVFGMTRLTTFKTLLVFVVFFVVWLAFLAHTIARLCSFVVTLFVFLSLLCKCCSLRWRSRCNFWRRALVVIKSTS